MRAAFFDDKHGRGLKSLLIAGAALLDTSVADDLGKSFARPIKRAWLTMTASMCVAVGCGLLMAGLFVLIQPHVGSAAAFAALGFIALAAGGGLLLHLRQK
ncbi:MAG: hypothetical protein WD768_06775 [Phycisphaeraceae bacterium]